MSINKQTSAAIVAAAAKREEIEGLAHPSAKPRAPDWAPRRGPGSQGHTTMPGHAKPGSPEATAGERQTKPAAVAPRPRRRARGRAPEEDREGTHEGPRTAPVRTVRGARGAGAGPGPACARQPGRCAGPVAAAPRDGEEGRANPPRGRAPSAPAWMQTLELSAPPSGRPELLIPRRHQQRSHASAPRSQHPRPPLLPPR